MNSIVKEDVANIIENGGDMWARFAGKTVLVTGANGLIPYYFVVTLLVLNESVLKGRECRVIGLVRNRQKAEAKFQGLLERNDFKLLVQDVTEPMNFSSPVDFMIHAASQASPKYYAEDPVGTFLPNVIGTLHLLEIAKRLQSEGFLFVSGGEIYGVVPDEKIPTKEEDYGWLDPMSVRSCYAEGKRAGETLCVAWHKQHDVPAVVARLAHTYGPGLDFKDGRVFADFVRDVVQGQDIRLSSDGSATRSFCYMTDAILGMFMVLLKGERGKAYNVCNDEACVSIRELAEMLVGLFPEKKLSVKFSGDKAPTGYMKSPISRSCIDSSRLRTLGWRPRVGIREGFRRTVLSFAS